MFNLKVKESKMLLRIDYQVGMHYAKGKRKYQSEIKKNRSNESVTSLQGKNVIVRSQKVFILENELRARDWRPSNKSSDCFRMLKVPWYMTLYIIKIIE